MAASIGSTTDRNPRLCRSAMPSAWRRWPDRRDPGVARQDRRLRYLSLTGDRYVPQATIT